MLHHHPSKRRTGCGLKRPWRPKVAADRVEKSLSPPDKRGIEDVAIVNDASVSALGSKRHQSHANDEEVSQPSKNQGSGINRISSGDGSAQGDDNADDEDHGAAQALPGGGPRGASRLTLSPVKKNHQSLDRGAWVNEKDRNRTTTGGRKAPPEIIELAESSDEEV